MKDKIKKIKDIDEFSHVNQAESDIHQCSICKAIFTGTHKHKCAEWFVCSVCGLDLNKNKPYRVGKFTTYKYKKNYKLMGKIFCWECAFKIHKQIKKDLE